MVSMRHPRALPFLIALASLLVSLSAVEVGFRLAGFDFEQKARSLEKVPIFFRRPMVPFGEAFYRRAGPARWDGKVLTPMLRRSGLPEHLLPEESEVSILYDDQGFRNPLDLDDWEVVVVGDSFTELGYLPYEDLFTTLVGDQLQVRVKNLGISFTGPFTYVALLREYGHAESTRHAIMAFFEGNDVGNLAREANWLRMASRRRNRQHEEPVMLSPLDEMRPQSSFVRALYDLATRDWFGGERREPNCVFSTAASRVPVIVNYLPPAANEVNPALRHLLAEALHSWARTAREFGMKPWLLYIPCKRRVLHDHLAQLPNTTKRIAEWTPTDLPAMVRSVSEKHGIEFVDATSELRSQTADGRLTYNRFDSHVNRLGSATIARVLVEELRSAGVGAR